MNFGFGELVVIFLIVLVIFGAGKLPAIGDALGRSIRNFKKASNSDELDVTPPRRDSLPASTATPAPREEAHEPARKV